MTHRHFLVIGAQRCGTTYLHDLLDAHPQVTMARPARPEPKVFLADEVLERGHDWYDATWFGHAGTHRLRGEKSTSYLESAEAPRRVRAVLGEVPLVVQLRDPLARAVSNWRFSVAGGLEERPLSRALAENLEGPRPWDPGRTSVSPYAYLERGRYVEALQPWFEVFGEKVHVQLLEDLLREQERPDGQDTVVALWRHLGVDDAVRPSSSAPVNASPAPAGPGVTDGPDDHLDPEVEHAVRAWFRDADAHLAATLGRRLPWQGEPHPAPEETTSAE